MSLINSAYIIQIKPEALHTFVEIVRQLCRHLLKDPDSMQLKYLYT